jgi:hypothetical protein
MSPWNLIDDLFVSFLPRSVQGILGLIGLAIVGLVVFMGVAQ